jgi:hypothetical protein
MDGAGQIFFANVTKVALTSPAGASIVAGTLLFPCAGAFDVTAFDVVGGRVYWTTQNDLCTRAANTSATTLPPVVAVHADAGAVLTAFAADGAWLVYAERLLDGTTEVRARPPSSLRTVVVASTGSIVRHVALSGSAAYWVDGLAVRASPLAFTPTFADGPIVTAGPTMNIGVATSDPTSLRIGPLGAFVSTPRGLEHMTLGSSRMIVSGAIDAFALDGINVYWTSTPRGVVAKTSLFTGVTTILASGVHPGGVAVDAQSVFLVDESRSMTTIVQITPK